MKLKVLILVLALSGCVSSTYVTTNNVIEPITSTSPNEIAVEEKVSSLHLTAVGDHLVHGAVYKAAATTDGSYDFSSMYTSIEPMIEGSDLNYINLETLAAGKTYGYSGYPQFNGPSEIIDDLVETGFNWFALSSNHSYDYGVNALLDELNHLRSYDNVITSGVHDSLEDANSYTVVTINDIKIGILGYTYGLNGLVVDPDYSYLIDLIDSEKIANDLDNLSNISDIQIVSIHWGNEYQTSPNNNQTELAYLMANHGADIIIGTHPHVIQPLEIIEQENGSQCVVMYSLGNFISAQNKFETMVEAFLDIELTYDHTTKTINYDSIIVEPLVNYISAGYSDFSVLPLQEYSNSHQNNHQLAYEGIDMSVSRIKDFFNSIYGQYSSLVSSNH